MTAHAFEHPRFRPIIEQHDALIGDIVDLTTALDTLPLADPRCAVLADRLAEATRRAATLWDLIEDADCYTTRPPETLAA